MAPVKVTPGVVAARDVRCRTHTAEKFRTSAKDVNVNVENGYITVTKGDGVRVRPTVFSGEAQRARIAKLSRPLRSVRYGSFEEN